MSGQKPADECSFSHIYHPNVEVCVPPVGCIGEVAHPVTFELRNCIGVTCFCKRGCRAMDYIEVMIRGKCNLAIITGRVGRKVGIFCVNIKLYFHNFKSD